MVSSPKEYRAQSRHSRRGRLGLTGLWMPPQSPSRHKLPQSFRRFFADQRVGRLFQLVGKPKQESDAFTGSLADRLVLLRSTWGVVHASSVPDAQVARY